MEIATYRLIGGIGTIYNIYFLGDIHEGSANHAETEFMQAVKIIRDDPNGLWVGMGDYVEAINVNDKRFNPVSIASHYEIRDLKDLPYKQMEYFFSKIEPIQDKCIALLIGNHEEKLIQYSYNDIYDRLVSMFETPPIKLGYVGFLRLTVDRNKREGHNGRHQIVVALNHGDGGSGKLMGYPINKVADCFQGLDGDVNIIGHIHKLKEDTIKLITINRKGDKIIKRWKYYGTSGCFMYTYQTNSTNYFEHKGRYEAEIGMLKLEIKITQDKPIIHLNKIILG